MKNQMIIFWRCIFGPKLYQVYPSQPIPPATVRIDQQPEHIYKKNTAESLSDHVFLAIKISIGILQVTWPIGLIYCYRKGLLTPANGILSIRMLGCLTILSVYFLLLRGVGRFVNPMYKNFLEEYSRLLDNSTSKERDGFLSTFDFSLSHWKPDFIMDTAKIRKAAIDRNDAMVHSSNRTILERIFHYPTQLLGYICVNVFGRRLMFPGSLQLLKKMIERPLLDGRTNLIVQHRAKRRLLRTADGHQIDTVFVDRRKENNSMNETTLVITCEGNAGFYEVGCMSTPLEAGYSVLGWNRPGFGESSGYPDVLTEINGIDAVMRYALDELRFPIENIIILAWSIGGYSACWAAAHYQDIHGVVLDAVFDDVLPLAQRQMPAFASDFVEKAIRHYLDLNNVPLLKMYQGPFYLIRRSQDEIISLVPGAVETNRGNELLFKVLRHRYPMIYHDDQTLTLLRRYLCASPTQRAALYDQHCQNEAELELTAAMYCSENPIASYPCQFGENFSSLERQRFAIFLIDRYLVNFDSQHCSPLPTSYFRKPSRCI